MWYKKSTGKSVCAPLQYEHPLHKSNFALLNMPCGINITLPLINVIAYDSSVMINNAEIIYVRAALIW